MIKKFLLLLSMVCLSQTYSFAGKGPWASQEALKKDAESWNKSLPQMIDDETLFFNVELKPSRLVFQHKITTLELGKLSKDDTFLLMVKLPMLLPHIVCTETPFKKVYLDNDVNLTYAYYDKKGSLLTEITVTKKSCDAVH